MMPMTLLSLCKQYFTYPLHCYVLNDKQKRQGTIRGLNKKQMGLRIGNERAV